jgi:hypothetical protein
MKGNIIDNTPPSNNDSLLAAFAMLQPMPVVVYEYRIYYDPITKDCLFKTIEKPEGTFITVTSEQYEEITFCPNYYVTNSGYIIEKKINGLATKLLSISNTGFRVLKDNMIFKVDDNETTHETEFFWIE